MKEIIGICILGVAALFGLLLWLVFIAGQEQEHINPDIFEEESNHAWALDAGVGGSVKPGVPENSGRSVLQCGACGREAELFELPGRKEKYCFECSADVATSILLAAEIHAADGSGEDTARSTTECLQVRRRFLARAQPQ
jgi:hypothetical protein